MFLCHGSYSFASVDGMGWDGRMVVVGYYFLRRFMEIENIVFQVIFFLFAAMKNIFSLTDSSNLWGAQEPVEYVSGCCTSYSDAHCR